MSQLNRRQGDLLSIYEKLKREMESMSPVTETDGPSRMPPTSPSLTVMRRLKPVKQKHVEDLSLDEVPIQYMLPI